MISEKQILKAEKPGDIFTNDIKIIKNEYKELVKIYHPDVNTSPNAKDIFQKINNFYNIALKDIEEKRWEKKNFIRINKTNGKAIEATYLSSIKFELGETYVCNKHIIYVFDSDKKKYKDNMISSIKAIKYENKKMEEEFKRYFPTILDEFTTTEGKHVVVISKTEDVFPLKDVLNYFNNKIENRHVAWIISRLQNICCFLKYNNIVHNGININNCFISPEHHAILLLGGWWYATKTDEKMIGTTKEIFDIMPILSKSNKKSSPITDLESIKLLGRTLCGYSNPRTFMKETDIPKPIAEFLIGGSGDDAYKEFQTWDTVLDKGYGVRKFIPLTVTQKQIYNL